ncbi:MAG: hypothetical protein LUC50_02070 [Ruminococcus sp.]|nr:hypothetical protein [Ruminococcus sp.]
MIHKAVNLQTRVTGDEPSVTKSLKSLQPKTIRGKAFKKSAQFANFMAHDAVQTAADLSLAAETATLKTGQAVQRNVKYKLKQKYRQEAADDYHRGTIATLGIAADAVKGTRSHFKQKKAFRLEKARYKVKKAEYKLFMDEQYKLKSKSIKTTSKSLKKDRKLQRKIKQKQWQIADISRPAPLLLKPAGYTGKN